MPRSVCLFENDIDRSATTPVSNPALIFENPIIIFIEYLLKDFNFLKSDTYPTLGGKVRLVEHHQALSQVMNLAHAR